MALKRKKLYNLKEEVKIKKFTKYMHLPSDHSQREVPGSNSSNNTHRLQIGTILKSAYRVVAQVTNIYYKDSRNIVAWCILVYAFGNKITNNVS